MVTLTGNERFMGAELFSKLRFKYEGNKETNTAEFLPKETQSDTWTHLFISTTLS